MVEKGTNQKYADIQPPPFHNDDTIIDHLNTKGKYLVALQPMYLLNYVVYPSSEAISSTKFDLFIPLNQNRIWGMNFMNDGK